MLNEIIKHLEDLEYRINGEVYQLATVKEQLSALAGIVGDIAAYLYQAERNKNP